MPLKKGFKTMTTQMQKEFLRDYTESVLHGLNRKLDEGKVPACWDGHELRVWFADIVKSDASISLIRKHPHSARARKFRNDVVVNGL